MKIHTSIILVLALVVCGCAANTRTASTPSAPVDVVELSGHLRVHDPQPPKGTLVLGWLSAAEAREWSEHHSMVVFRSLLERLDVVGPVDLAQPVVYRLKVPPGSVPFAVLDVERTFWDTMFGGGKGWMGMGSPGNPDVELRPPPSSRPRGSDEPCSGERMRLLVVHAPEVAGTLGNGVDRRLCAWLPPSYASLPQRRYPVVVMLPGMGGNEMTRLWGTRHTGHITDELAEKTGREVILVGVDSRTTFGSSYFEDSPITGKWETFITQTVLTTVDGELRTLVEPHARALLGQSTGGFNALSLALRHPNLFGATAASAPDAPDLPSWLLTDGKVKPWILGWTRLEARLNAPMQMASYAADWSPQAPGGWSWPFDLDSGTPTSVLDTWVAHTPAGLLKREEVVQRTRHTLNDRIFIIVGTRDEFELHAPAVAFSRELQRLGIGHTLVETPHGHLDGVQERVQHAMEWLLPRLSAAR